MSAFARGAAAHGALSPVVLTIDPGQPDQPPGAALASGTGALFFVAEIEVYRPGQAFMAERGWGARPRGAPAPPPGPLESTDVIRVSDRGYRTRATDTGGVVPYPGVLTSAFEVDRRMPLSPSSPAAAAGWGAVVLSNAGRRWDEIANSRNSDGRPVRILAGRKAWDATRGIELDPPRAALLEVFTGIGQPWGLGEAELSVPLRDAGYWLERPFQQATLAGTGGYEGTAEMAGRLKPRARGGTALLPIRDVGPVWIDRVNNVAQLSDAPGMVVAVSENGDPDQILPEPGGAQVTDLLGGSASPGHYRWCSRPDGLFLQLGSISNGTVTCDVVGHFPGGEAVSTAAGIARRLLLDDLGLSPEMIDDGSFTGLDLATPWTAGDYWDGSAEVDGLSAVALFLGSLGAKLVPDRRGRLRAFPLRPIPADARPAAIYGTGEIVRCTPSPRLAQAGLSPQPYRWRVGYARANTLITSNLDEDASSERRAFLAEEYRYGSWASTAIAAAYRRPNDPAPVPTRLLDGGPAALLAEQLGALWSGPRAPRLYEVELRTALALRHEIGDVLELSYPLDDLDAGRLGQIVGERFRSVDGTVLFEVLV